MYFSKVRCYPLIDDALYDYGHSNGRNLSPAHEDQDIVLITSVLVDFLQVG